MTPTTCTQSGQVITITGFSAACTTAELLEVKIMASGTGGNEWTLPAIGSSPSNIYEWGIKITATGASSYQNFVSMYS